MGTNFDAYAIMAAAAGVPAIVAGAILARKLESPLLSRLCSAAAVLGILAAASGLFYFCLKYGLLWLFDQVASLAG
jgi:hypothetical protein